MISLLNRKFTNRESIGLSILAAALFAGVPILMHLLPWVGNYFASKGLDLSGDWEYCAQSHSTPVIECNWQRIKLPRPQIHSKLATANGQMYLRKTFETPKFCDKTQSTCALIIGEFDGTQVVSVNGQEVGEHGDFTFKSRQHSPYPLFVSIPIYLLHKSDEPNTLVLKVEYYQPFFNGIKRGPISLLPGKSAFHVAEFLIAETVVLPLITGLSLLFMGILSLGMLFNQISTENKKLIVGYATYCIVASLFLFSLTRLPRSILAIDVSHQFHFILRFSCDLCLLYLTSLFLNTNRLFIRISFLLIVIVIFTYIAMPLIELYQKGQIELNSYTNLAFTITQYGVITLILSPLGVLLGLLKLWTKNFAYRLLVILFALICVFQILDIITFFGWISGPYYARLFPFLTGIAFGAIAWSSRFQELKQMEVSAQIGKLSTQVAHDIRSPLATLKVIESELAPLPEDTRTCFQIALNRIQAISSDLLKAEKGERAKLFSDGGNLEEIEVIGLLKQLIQEKNAEYRNRERFKITLRYPIDRIYVLGHGPTLLRILSNLINNSVEARSAQVTLDVSHHDDKIRIQVIDDGQGIPTHLLETLGTRKITVGKPNGNGLGLFHAREALLEWGGTFRIESKSGSGTTITIDLPMHSVTHRI